MPTDNYEFKERCGWLKVHLLQKQYHLLKCGTKAKHKIEKDIYHKCSYLRKVSCYRNVRWETGTTYAITKPVGTLKNLGNARHWFRMSDYHFKICYFFLWHGNYISF